MKTSSKITALALAGSAALLPAVANAAPEMPQALVQHGGTIGIIVAFVAGIWAICAGVLVARQLGKQSATKN